MLKILLTEFSLPWRAPADWPGRRRGDEALPEPPWRAERRMEIERRLLRFPEEVRAAAAELEPHRLFRFTLDLAARVEDLTGPRTAAEAKNVRPEVTAELAGASRIVLRNALRILGVSAPE